MILAGPSSRTVNAVDDVPYGHVKSMASRVS